ncbi:hypothetical protein PGTUg99_007631 [Puccinia graminis f. sp. tritici]|uniref:Uncharacterized protein n=1 Tax=Puccinia graminis f. sp. tritici TaxID=56615 RepID=A0A5B0M0H4_PUCGR|nr:hypothetical protein PGTUg99_007631 [Puccinia graminis f. sp. tritici]
MCLAGHLEGGYPRISAQIPAKAGGYPPGDADAGADAAFPGKSNRISASARISGCNTTISKTCPCSSRFSLVFFSSLI